MDPNFRGAGDSLRVSSLVAQLLTTGCIGADRTVGADEFTVTVGVDGLRIARAVSSNAPKSAFLEGQWQIKSPHMKSSLTNIAITGENALHGVLLEASVGQKTGDLTIDLDRALLFHDHEKRLSHLIKDLWWYNLTRSIEITNKALSNIDSKIITDDPRPRIYIPNGTPEQYEHFSGLAKKYPEIRLDVQSLPAGPLDPHYIKTLNEKPGLLALAMESSIGDNGEPTMVPLPYVVPGGRFNEMYGWDTYFTVLGLLEDGLTELCESMQKNFCFCIQHYGKIFNANRTYYLGRSQPPFLTSMGMAICEKLGKSHSKASDLARLTLIAAIKEYHTVWTSGAHYDPQTGLSRYYGEGEGFPPECEPHHFDDEVIPLAAKYDMSASEFAKAYDNGEIKVPELDEYLTHDRACRESGHDTTYRFVGRAADLATVDLNSCLHKYEIDIASLIDTYCGGKLEIPNDWRAVGCPEIELATSWVQRAATRREAMTKYLWCPEKGMFFDYDTKEHTQMSYESATSLWPLWAKAASASQAEDLVRHALPKLETYGGLSASTETSRGAISASRPQRQWDYPYGWAPHQILAWDGLIGYGFIDDAERLIYRWTSMVLKTFTNHNGLVVEKYDVTSEDKSHVVEAEYGNQGSDFDSEVQTG